MKHKQRKRKHEKAKLHVANQAARKQAAIEDATALANNEKGFVRGMEAEGYVPNGRGGWRPIHTVKQTDTISKA
jgi:hypothetical protein